MWVFYFLGLLGVWFLGNYVFKSKGILLPIYVGSLTPLFFIEALRFENDLFAWTLSFLGLGLFCLYLEAKNKPLKATLLILIGLCLVFSLFTWLASILVWFSCILMLIKSDKLRKTLILVFVAIFVIIFYKYILQSFTSLIFSPSLIAEEIPFVGLIFIIHIIHYWNKTPQPFHYYSIILLIVGLIKVKYLYLATPFLLMGLIHKELTEGIIIRKKTIPVIFFVILFLFGFIFMGLNMYPTQEDMGELQTAINLAKDNNLQLYNDWGDGWMLIYLGYPTEYKCSIPQPDWNNLPKPYIGWSKREIIDCNNLTKKIYYCP